MLKTDTTRTNPLLITQFELRLLDKIRQEVTDQSVILDKLKQSEKNLSQEIIERFTNSVEIEDGNIKVDIKEKSRKTVPWRKVCEEHLGGKQVATIIDNFVAKSYFTVDLKINY